MARQSPFEWLVEKLEDNENVDSTAIVSENLLTIKRTDGSNLNVTKSTLNHFIISDIKNILSVQNADFILHTPKQPFVDGSVFYYLESKQIVLGGFGDLTRVVNQGHNFPYLPPDVHFIFRGLKQHTKVSGVRRLDNKRYEVERHGLETVTIIALNDYDLGVESIRAAVDEFDKFDAVLKSNPNGKITTSALELADSREIKAFKWGELMSKLNLKWNWKQ